MESGIYRILCIKNNKPYIGKSEDVQKRKEEHFNKLRNGNHPCKELQDDFNTYGEDAFDFSVLEECDQEKLNHLEDYYILSCNAISHGYNSKRGDVLSLSENDFNDENDTEVLSIEKDFENARTEINERPFDYMCLQTYIYELNNIYNQEKTIDYYLDYIIADEINFMSMKIICLELNGKK